jgi:predicted MPP superfamily phosphohydrolase
LTPLGFQLFVVGVFLLPDVVWWWWADRQVRRKRWARGFVAAFVLAMMVFPIALVFFREIALRSHEFAPMVYLAATFLWHFLILPATLLVVGVRAVAGRVCTVAAPGVDSRRRFLTGMVALAPPVVTGIGCAIAIPRLNQLRLREIDVPVPGLPAALNGMVIAHISDPHFGKFTRKRSIDRAVEFTNSIHADLVLGTGDWIDLSLVDFPQVAEFFERLDPRSGMFVCEGNHDLIDDPAQFRIESRDAEIPLLVDTDANLQVRGVPVQILGARWRNDPVDSMHTIQRMRRRNAFPIVLAHHPHAFDWAAGFPLTLAGHTHGGQLMLNEKIGAGSMIFRYWSGLYRKPDRSLVVSNGIGHWFPLRTAAPAEVLKLTLHRA